MIWKKIDERAGLQIGHRSTSKFVKTCTLGWVFFTIW
jgi:hypothetical protein